MDGASVGQPFARVAFEVLDPGITSPETLKEVIANLSPLARKWKIATRIFRRALLCSQRAVQRG